MDEESTGGGDLTHLPGEELLRLSDISVSYPGREVLREFSLTVGKGEFVCLVGRNGAGKSTLLKALCGLNRLDSGTIHLDGKRIDLLPAFRRARLGVSTALQGHRVFRGLSVRQNLEISARSAEDGVDLGEIWSEFPQLAVRKEEDAGNLSGGTKQLLAIASCLAGCPRILLMDEPTLGLAAPAAKKVFQLLNKLRHNSDRSLIVAEHRWRAAISRSDRVVALRDGKITLDEPAQKVLADWTLVERACGPPSPTQTRP